MLEKKYYETELLRTQVAAMNIGNEAMEKIENGIEIQINELCNDKASKLASDNKIELEPEEFRRLSHSIKTLGELMYKGVEVYGSLEAPEGYAESFPNTEEYKKLSSSLLELKEGETQNKVEEGQANNVIETTQQ